MKSRCHAALLGAAVLLLAAMSARAQSPVFTVPNPMAVGNGSGSIAVTNVFQPIFQGAPGRRGCAIQNTGTHTMFVYFGQLANATTTNSFPLAGATAAGQPGGWITCAAGGLVSPDPVSITGTAGDSFVATVQ